MTLRAIVADLAEELDRETGSRVDREALRPFVATNYEAAKVGISGDKPPVEYNLAVLVSLMDLWIQTGGDGRVVRWVRRRERDREKVA